MARRRRRYPRRHRRSRIPADGAARARRVARRAPPPRPARRRALRDRRRARRVAPRRRGDRPVRRGACDRRGGVRQRVGGDVSGSIVTGLGVLGQPVAARRASQIALADWGVLDVSRTVDGSRPAPLRRDARARASSAFGCASTSTTVGARGQRDRRRGRRGERRGRRAGAAPSGASGPREAKAPAAPPRATAVRSSGSPARGQGQRQHSDSARSRAGPVTAGAGARQSSSEPVPEGVLPRKLASGGYVFPVYGPASHGDSFGAPRGAYVGGWHHGEDIFAPLGTPLLAVADGTVFSVGWNQYRRLAALATRPNRATSSTTPTSRRTRLSPSTGGKSRQARARLHGQARRRGALPAAPAFRDPSRLVAVTSATTA